MKLSIISRSQLEKKCQIESKWQQLSFACNLVSYTEKDPEGLLLKCVDAREALTHMAEIHQGLCGANQNDLKMR